MASEKKDRVSLQTPVGIATFCHLWEPKAMKSTNPKAAPRDPMYSVMLVFTEDQKDELKALRVACIKAAKAKFGEEEYEKLKKKNKLSMPWRDASEYEEYGEPFVEGNTMINFKTNAQNPPQIVDQRAKPITDRSKIYSGCKMRVSFGVWAFDTDGNKGVTLLLNNVQKAGDGPKLSGRADASEEFESIDAGDDADDDEDDDIL